jgi:hypothetical protein
MDQDKQEIKLLCTNCDKYFLETARPLFMAKMIIVPTTSDHDPKDYIVKINICPDCMARPYIINDRIIKMAFRNIGQQATLNKDHKNGM